MSAFTVLEPLDETLVSRVSDPRYEALKYQAWLVSQGRGYASAYDDSGVTVHSAGLEPIRFIKQQA